MSRPIEQALSNLIPRQPGALPPELIELASSLLAQSKHKASNLKAEEEIGRLYACANIACERLKTTLNLPPIEPRPPIPPRAYNKLYSYFDRTLTISSARRRASAKASNSTPASTSKSTPNSSRNTTQKPLPQKLTPSKDKSFESFRSNRTPRKGLQYGGRKEKDERVPKWVPPVIRMLCTELETRKAIPHVLAGVESVLCLPPPQIEDSQGKGKDKKMEGKIPALIAAVWFWVLGRLTGKDTNGEEYKKRRLMVMDVLATVESSEWVAERVGQEEDAWEGWETVGSKDIQGWVIELKEKAWLEMDWYENIVEGADVDGVGDGDDEELESSRTFEELSRAGLGTMKLDKFDYLTERKKAEYEVWKGKMLRMIDELVEEGVLDDEGEEMDIAEG